MSLHRRPSMKISLPKSPKFQKSSLTPKRRLNFNIIQQDSKKDSNFSQRHSTQRSNSNIQSIVESFLNTRYSDPQHQSSSNPADTNMISRIKKVTEKKHMHLTVSDCQSSHRDQILQILSIVEEETLKYDERLDNLKLENFKLKENLSKSNFKHEKQELSVEGIIKLYVNKNNEFAIGFNEKINLLRDLVNTGCKGNLDNRIQEIIDGEEERLIGVICKEIVAGREWVGEKAKGLEVVRERKLQLEEEIRLIEDGKLGVRGEIDLLELAETWTDVSYSDEYGKKSKFNET